MARHRAHNPKIGGSIPPLALVSAVWHWPTLLFWLGRPLLIRGAAEGNYENDMPGNLIRLHIIKCLRCHDLGFVLDPFDHSKRTPCTCQAARPQPPATPVIHDPDKHTSRLTQVGTGRAWQSQQVYMRMLRHKPTIRYRIEKVLYLSEPPSDPVIFGDSHGTVYFNEATGVVSVVLADPESDAEELAAGQVGPMENM